jgi:hypothetical protein
MIFTKKAPAATLGNIQSFLDNTRGQITIGEIPPLRRAALAAQGKKARAWPSCPRTEKRSLSYSSDWTRLWAR